MLVLYYLVEMYLIKLASQQNIIFTFVIIMNTLLIYQF